MAARNILDRQPGPMPAIRAEGESVTFHFTLTGVHEDAQLVIRCHADGAVWASIAVPQPRVRDDI